MPARDPRASFSLSPLGQEVLASYIKAESKAFENFTKFYKAFVQKVTPLLNGRSKVINSWTISRWKEPGRQSAISADSLLQLSLYRDEPESATRLWLGGGDPQGPFLDRFLEGLRAESMTRHDLAEILSTVAYRISSGNFEGGTEEGGQPEKELAAVAPAQSLLTLRFSHDWYPVLVRAAALFGEPHKTDPDEFYREHQIKPEIVTALLARQDLTLTESDLMILVETISQDEPGMTAPELMALFKGQEEAKP
jgi:hypothetical protein